MNADFRNNFCHDFCPCCINILPLLIAATGEGDVAPGRPGNARPWGWGVAYCVPYNGLLMVRYLTPRGCQTPPCRGQACQPLTDAKLEQSSWNPAREYICTHARFDHPFVHRECLICTIQRYSYRDILSRCTSFCISHISQNSPRWMGKDRGERTRQFISSLIPPARIIGSPGGGGRDTLSTWKHGRGSRTPLSDLECVRARIFVSMAVKGQKIVGKS